MSGLFKKGSYQTRSNSSQTSSGKISDNLREGSNYSSSSTRKNTPRTNFNTEIKAKKSLLEKSSPMDFKLLSNVFPPKAVNFIPQKSSRPIPSKPIDFNRDKQNHLLTQPSLPQREQSVNPKTSYDHSRNTNFNRSHFQKNFNGNNGTVFNSKSNSKAKNTKLATNLNNPSATNVKIFTIKQEEEKKKNSPVMGIGSIIPNNPNNGQEKCFSCHETLKPTEKNKFHQCKTHIYCKVCILKPKNIEDIKKKCANCYKDLFNTTRVKTTSYNSRSSTRQTLNSAPVKSEVDYNSPPLTERHNQRDFFPPDNENPPQLTPRSNQRDFFPPDNENPPPLTPRSNQRDFLPSDNENPPILTPRHNQQDFFPPVNENPSPLTPRSNQRDFFPPDNKNPHFQENFSPAIQPYHSINSKNQYEKNPQTVNSDLHPLYHTTNPNPHEEFQKNSEVLNEMNPSPFSNQGVFNDQSKNLTRTLLPNQNLSSNNQLTGQILIPFTETQKSFQLIINSGHQRQSRETKESEVGSILPIDHNYSNKINLYNSVPAQKIEWDKTILLNNSNIQCFLCKRTDQVKSFLCNHNLCEICITFQCCSNIYTFFTQMQIEPKIVDQPFSYTCPYPQCSKKISVPTLMVLQNYMRFVYRPDIAEYFKFFECSMTVVDQWIPYFDGLSYREVFNQN